jgi:hypothetical protein
VNEFLLGALSMGFFVIALFFWRFWRRTRDRFFALFAAAFLIMSANQISLLMFGEDSELKSWLYAVRLAAFLVILTAIVDKNRD